MLKKILYITILSGAIHSFSWAAPVWTNTDKNIDFIETDVSVSGDALATLDYSTGLEWLDFSETAGLSINQARNETLSGGQFEGWRLPSAGEVTQLFNNWFNYNSDGQTVQNSSWSTWGPNTTWTSVFGETFGYTNGPRTHALYEGVDDVPLLLGVGQFSNDVLYFNYNSGQVNTYNESSAYFGILLVSDGGTTQSSINNPSLNINNPNAPINNVPVTFFGSVALLGFAVARRKNRP